VPLLLSVSDFCLLIYVWVVGCRFTYKFHSNLLVPCFIPSAVFFACSTQCRSKSACVVEQKFTLNFFFVVFCNTVLTLGRGHCCVSSFMKDFIIFSLFTIRYGYCAIGKMPKTFDAFHVFIVVPAVVVIVLRCAERLSIVV